MIQLVLLNSHIEIQIRRVNDQNEIYFITLFGVGFIQKVIINKKISKKKT